MFIDDLFPALVDAFDKRPPLKVVQINVPFQLFYVFYRASGKDNPRKSTLIKILFVSHLPYEISMSLLYCAGFTLNSSTADVFYASLLENPKTVLNIYDVNEIIEERNESKGKIVIPPFKV